MYKCNECGGFLEELGDMAVSDGGCVCAQKKAEESANSLQLLKTEIALTVSSIARDTSIPAVDRLDKIVMFVYEQLSSV